MRSTVLWSGLIIALVLMTVGFGGCPQEYPDVASNAPADNQQGVLFDKAQEQVKTVMAIQDRHTPALMANTDIVGTATGLTEDGRLAIMVYTKSDPLTTAKGKSVAGQVVPELLDGVPVVIEVTGPLKAMVGEANRAKQTPPIQLGTSGGWRYDLANGYCCGGTLGGLIQKGGTQYVLSNYHVLMADIVSGGNGRVATAGDPVIQPGLIDVACNANNAQNVATLEGTKSLPGSNVDAAIAQIVSGMVRTDGSIIGVGTLSASTVAASLNQAVKKSGRTTGLQRSTVSGLNGTVTITYENECAGGTAFSKTFTGQIIIKNSRCKFLNGGDSGSLMVQDVTTNPKAVGLLFAGSTLCNTKAIAIANPIGQVLSFFGATMVGN